MYRTFAYVTIFSVVLAMTSGVYLGLNIGVAFSDDEGPKAACERIRWPIYDCATFKTEN